MCVYRSSCSFRSSAGSVTMNFMMLLLIIAASHGPFSLGRIEHYRNSRRTLAFNERVDSSSSHVVEMKEEILATEEAMALHYYLNFLFGMNIDDWKLRLSCFIRQQ